MDVQGAPRTRSRKSRPILLPRRSQVMFATVSIIRSRAYALSLRRSISSINSLFPSASSILRSSGSRQPACDVISAVIPASRAGKWSAGEGDLRRILTLRPNAAAPRHPGRTSSAWQPRKTGPRDFRAQHRDGQSDLHQLPPRKP
jgi:hypothetical protein